MEYDVGSETYFLQDKIIYQVMVTKVFGVNGTSEYDIMIMRTTLLPPGRRVLFELEPGRVLRARVNQNGALEEKV